MNEDACNHDPTALYNGGCVFVVPGFDCDGACLDDDDDGVCNFEEVEGCTNAEAFNYDPLATDDDESCEAVIEGCTLLGACNFDDDANVNDGSCEFASCSGCLSSSACNYNPEAIYAAECIYPEEGYDCEGVCLSDLDGDGLCDPFENGRMHPPLRVQLQSICDGGRRKL